MTGVHRLGDPPAGNEGRFDPITQVFQSFVADLGLDVFGQKTLLVIVTRHAAHGSGQIVEGLDRVYSPFLHQKSTSEDVPEKTAREGRIMLTRALNRARLSSIPHIPLGRRECPRVLNTEEYQLEKRTDHRHISRRGSIRR